MNIESVKTRFGIVGHSRKLISAIEVAIQVAPTDVTVLIQGENGTGKDVFSKIVHQYSRRKHASFMAINTGAIPEGTMDSELFGHEKGSFTSAYETRKGYFEEVDGGTIFLDEIGEMPMATQARLLRVLENQEYLRVGSSKIRKTDVRVIAATNKNLIELIRKGKFREDLYFRLNTVCIQVPPLRERGADIEMLFQYFSDEFAHKYKRNPIFLSPQASDMLYQYRWPGNVRELKNFVEKLSVLVGQDEIGPEIIQEHLNIRDNYLPVFQGSARPEAAGDGQGSTREIEMLYKLIFDLREEMGDMKKMLFYGMQQEQPFPQEIEGHFDEEEHPEISIVNHENKKTYSRPVTQQSPTPLLEESLNLEKKEKDLITRALSKYGNNRKKAAQELGISERTLYRKIKQYEINQ